MGNGFKVICDECQFNQKFYLGIGMGFGFFNRGLSQIPILSKERLAHQLNNRNAKDHHYSYEVYHCDKCDNLSDDFYLKLILEDGETLEVSYDCKKCNHPMKLLKRPAIEKLNCPKCHQLSLKEDGYFKWD